MLFNTTIRDCEPRGKDVIAALILIGTAGGFTAALLAFLGGAPWPLILASYPLGGMVACLVWPLALWSRQAEERDPGPAAG